MLETCSIDAVDDLPVHLDQAPVGVVGEVLVPSSRQRLSGCVGEAEVEDRIHHPWHRDRRAGAHRDEQGVNGVSEPLARRFFETTDGLFQFETQPVRNHALVHEGPACIAGDREPAWHWQSHMGHLGQAEALAAELRAATRRIVIEVVYVARRNSSRSHGSSFPAHQRAVRFSGRRDQFDHPHCSPWGHRRSTR